MPINHGMIDVIIDSTFRLKNIRDPGTKISIGQRPERTRTEKMRNPVLDRIRTEIQSLWVWGILNTNANAVKWRNPHSSTHFTFHITPCIRLQYFGLGIYHRTINSATLCCLISAPLSLVPQCLRSQNEVLHFNVFSLW